MEDGEPDGGFRELYCGEGGPVVFSEGAGDGFLAVEGELGEGFVVLVETLERELANQNS